MRIVFLDRDTIGPTVNITRPSGEHEWIEYDRTSESQVVERLQCADIAVSNKVRLRGDSLKQLPQLKMISVAATGYDVIDIDACRELGITVSNVRGYAVNTVPEHTFALILGLRRSISAYQQDVRRGEWQAARQFCFFHHPIRDLAGSQLGIIGSGVIGQSVAAIARAFGMKPVFAAHKGTTGMGSLYMPWEDMLATSDIITLHAPLTPQTRHCIGAEDFAQMTRQPLIINTARGGLVDESALVNALETQQIGGFAFDVLSTEPPPDDHPIMQVLDRPNVIVTPHVAWASEEAMSEVWRQTIDHINAFIDGTPRNALC